MKIMRAFLILVLFTCLISTVSSIYKFPISIITTHAMAQEDFDFEGQLTAGLSIEEIFALAKEAGLTDEQAICGLITADALAGQVVEAAIIAGVPVDTVVKTAIKCAPEQYRQIADAARRLVFDYTPPPPPPPDTDDLPTSSPFE